MKPDRRGSWYLLTGVILGVVLGLLFSWEISPVKYVNAPPSALRSDYKDDYRALVALAYLYSSDLLRAESRLAQLKDDNPIQALTMQAQRAQIEGRPLEEVEALDTLAAAMSAKVTPEGEINTLTPQGAGNPTNTQSTTSLILVPTTIPTATSPATSANTNHLLVSSTNTPQLTFITTPSPTPGKPFVLRESQMVCNLNQTVPQIQVDIRDAAGQPVPNVEVIVSWEGGEGQFFTGLQPEMGLGYGDFALSPGVIYSLHLTDEGVPVNDLTVPECTSEDGSQYWGSWHLVFVQP